MNTSESSITHTPENLNAICEEYRTILFECGITETSLDDVDDEVIIEKLVTTCEWSPITARVLVNTAKTYGGFFLRNAAALAIAMGIEDGVTY